MKVVASDYGGRHRLPERTGHVLIKLGNAINALTERALAPLGLRGKHLHVLTLVSEHQLSQHELAELIGTDRTSMVGVIDDLERLGLAIRKRSETDRRKYLILPTDKAIDTLNHAVSMLDAAEHDLFQTLSPAEHTLLGDIAKRLLRKAAGGST